VVRSLTKLFAVAGLRLGYAIARPDRLARWAAWRDPWPINGLAAAVGGQLLVDQNWQNKVQRWVAKEGPWLAKQLQQFEGITPMPSAANFLLINSLKSLEPFRLKIEQQHRILLRDCRSFRGLNENYLRVALSDRAGNRRLIKALVAVANN
jgi:histidinol-phosphate/aromatic aminotransferase/cobyric acid decarboxylase-like protein